MIHVTQRIDEKLDERAFFRQSRVIVNLSWVEGNRAMVQRRSDGKASWRDSEGSAADKLPSSRI